ncbi:hypothetical protein [Rhodopila sp.]|uniref:hypothetical protein n=1 Tax=Rhodopila sp. TaxID=2480087 RepID=UPI002BC44EFA|nr:hypothetical protein [Rhodopila sp.]HVZ06308.1 hypothetical protein [Rhodopila sp.]
MLIGAGAAIIALGTYATTSRLPQGMRYDLAIGVWTIGCGLALVLHWPGTLVAICLGLYGAWRMVQGCRGSSAKARARPAMTDRR